MRKIAALLLLSMFACGPTAPLIVGPAPIGVQVENLYAESIFTIDLTSADGGTTRALDSVRIAGYDTQTFPRALSATVGDSISVAADIVSLGQHNQFTATTPVPSSNHTLMFTYDYDLALANFRLQYKWTY